MSRQNIRQNNNPSQQQYNNQNQTQQQQSSNQLVIPVTAKKALDILKKARANRSDFLSLESGITYTLQFDPSKAQVEQKNSMDR
jgi:hypothetical protein